MSSYSENNEKASEALQPKPCPFCGEMPDFSCNWNTIDGKHGGWEFQIVCECGVHAPTRNISEEAIAAWNRLAVVPDGPEDRLRRIEDRLDSLEENQESVGRSIRTLWTGGPTY